MGILGLSTFIQRYHDKHKDKIYLHDCPIVIDGCNLMFFLYFEGRQTLQPANGSTPQKRPGSASPLSKPSTLKQPHLFGGDYMTYAQNVREFFQHIKLCNITPIVIFDGAYDALKIKTAFKRFAENLKENVHSSGNNLKGITPGSSYSPVFMKAVFVEILQEQKILHYQTEQEADCTIAFIARKLQNCAILSSDSDFHIYTNAITLPLHTLRFKKVMPSKDKRKSETTTTASSPISKITKIWTLHSQYVSLAKLCREEFNLSDTRLLPLAAVILGNDWIRTSTFSHFHSTTAGGTKVNRNSRIAYLLKWLGKQRSYSHIVKAMLATVRESYRESTAKLVTEIVSIYEGLGGEEKVWNMLQETGQIDKFLGTQTQPENILNDMVSKLSLEESINGSPDIVDCSLLELEDNPDNDTDDIESETLEDPVEEDLDEMSVTRAESKETELKLPGWYLDAHLKCWLPTNLLKLARNQMVFLSPQAEVSSLPSTHTLSIPIIKVIGGILLGPDQTLTLITRQKSKIVEVKVQTTSELENWGILPQVSEDGADFRKLVPIESRVQILLETLGIHNSEFVEFVNQWPPILRIWIVCLLYFIRSTKDEGTEESNTLLLVNKTVLPVALAILVSIIKNNVLNPSGSRASVESNHELNSISGESNQPKISELLNQSDASNISMLRIFYTKYEMVIDTSSRNFTRSYDISRAYNLSRFTCILFHLHQLNRLLGDPLRAPRLNYNLNNWVVYNFSGRMTAAAENTEFINSGCQYAAFIGEMCGVHDIQTLIERFLQFA